jgi:CDGSH-type Zn-finger protein
MATPHVAQAAPYKFTAEEGKSYYWCACGLSKSQPLCDGSHKGTDFRPLAWTADKTGDVWMCGCKATHQPPLCDGSHKNL